MAKGADKATQEARIAFIKANPDMKTSEMAKALGVTAGTVVYYKRKLGIPLRRLVFFSMKERAEIMESYLNGEPVVFIAKRFARDRHTINSVIRQIKNEAQDNPNP